MEYCLGFSYSGMHDSNITLMNSEGKIIFAINEERFSLIKKDGSWPKLSIEFLKKNLKKGDKIKKIYLPFESPHSIIKETNIDKDIFIKRKKILSLGYGVYNKKWEEKILKNFPKSELCYVGHHKSHAASGYFLSNFSQALIITCDSGCYNEPWVLTVSRGVGNKIVPIDQVSKNIYHSIAKSYSLITALLNFNPGIDEGKITGLSSRGKLNSDCLAEVRKIIYNSETEKLIYWKNNLVDGKVPVHKVNSSLKRKLKKNINKFSKEDIAFAIQKITEDEIIKIVRCYKKTTGEKNIVLAGGLFANVKLNKKISDLGFKHIFIAPPMSDEGLSLGAVLLGYYSGNNLKKHQINNMYFGPELENIDILIKKLNIKAERFIAEKKLIKTVASLLARGNIVAISRGKMEYGPRALGNRSILASPAIVNINNVLNQKLKRNEFMPFAPVVLYEFAEKCFKNIKNKKLSCCFMTIAVECSKYFKDKCSAVVHFDNTARPQLISHEVNFFYYGVLKEFSKLTSLPALINTSFNIHGEPIVCTTEDALRNFFMANLDYLVLGDYLIKYSDNQNFNHI